ncbi:MAG: NAD(+) kinase [Thiohalobacteraceae bacterium]
MAATFRHIGIIGKHGAPTVGDTLTRLITYLHGRDLAISLDVSAADQSPGTNLPILERDELAAQCDLAIVIGGDGTLLNAGRSLTDADVPLVGINLGRLGFLADVSPDSMTEQLGHILDGNYATEERSLLHATIWRGERELDSSDALNDVVVHKRDVARMIELEVHIDGRLLSSQRADGLIVATPTGSTAYALSGGGPILHPAMDAMVLVPICPHSLNNRPIVIDEASEICIAVHTGGGYTQGQITCDGQVNVPLSPGDRVRIRRKEKRLRLIHPPGYDYFEILRRKFHWGSSS